jgi:TolA-binding protein
MLRVALPIIVATPLLLNAAEPSAFGAGNLNNPEPYGLTSSEKVILNNKKTLRKVEINSNNQANKVESLQERLDGFQGIIESVSRKSHLNKINLEKFIAQRAQELESSDEYEKRLSEVTQTNSESIEKIKLVINELSQLIDSINSKYVSKSEFNSLVKDVNKFKSLIVKELKNTPVETKKVNTKSSFSKMSNAEIEQEAKKFYKKKYYTKAIERYTYLIEKKYKPATAHYMIGEMNFKRKKYDNAISYFKKSASLYSKASYMPNLMLHTAISMDKIGDKKNAKVFYNAIVTKYPNSQEAVEAKKFLG